MWSASPAHQVSGIGKRGWIVIQVTDEDLLDDEVTGEIQINLVRFCALFVLFCTVTYCFCALFLLFCTVLYCFWALVVLCCTVSFCVCALFVLFCTVLHCLCAIFVLFCTVLYCVCAKHDEFDRTRSRRTNCWMVGTRLLRPIWRRWLLYTVFTLFLHCFYTVRYCCLCFKMLQNGVVCASKCFKMVLFVLQNASQWCI